MTRARFLLSMAVLLHARIARADMTLTAAGQSAGFSLTTFATGFPSSFSVGPEGVAVLNGKVYVSDSPGYLRIFPNNSDGQNAANVPSIYYGLYNAAALALVGNTIYMGQFANGRIVQLNLDGTINQVIVGGLTNPTGIVTNPSNGHLFVATGANTILDVDPIAKASTLFVPASDPDGLTLSPDSSVLYAAVRGAGGGGHIFGYNTATKAIVFDSGAINGIDGTVLGVGPLAGFIYGNTNFGTIVQVNLATKEQTLIASGGSRGDFVTLDTTTGTLFVTQTDRILRLTPPAGGFVPEPSSYVQLAMGLVGLGGFAWRRARLRTGSTDVL